MSNDHMKEYARSIMRARRSVNARGMVARGLRDLAGIIGRSSLGYLEDCKFERMMVLSLALKAIERGEWKYEEGAPRYVDIEEVKVAFGDAMRESFDFIGDYGGVVRFTLGGIARRLGFDAYTLDAKSGSSKKVNEFEIDGWDLK